MTEPLVTAPSSLLLACARLGAGLAVLSAGLHAVAAGSDAHGLAMAAMAGFSLWCAVKLWRPSGPGAWRMLGLCAGAMVLLHGVMQWRMQAAMAAMPGMVMQSTSPERAMSAAVVVACSEMVLALFALWYLRRRPSC
ncbi:hypothetical protein [Pseudomonas sp. dw_358]|uniref:hypothetical protein n=1 Tax=Pseudomonas sp. dw_358 TaxID=2720083 RepID=UPI001BD4ADEB|nr:hypothetical protein [Pseudomonas sp. dw_358]